MRTRQSSRKHHGGKLLGEAWLDDKEYHSISNETLDQMDVCGLGNSTLASRTCDTFLKLPR
eukprot:scaffold23186_cov52-Cyclotella_meneghiniana.AAC.6